MQFKLNRTARTLLNLGLRSVCMFIQQARAGGQKVLLTDTAE
jgi:hypothetical protein